MNNNLNQNNDTSNSIGNMQYDKSNLMQNQYNMASDSNDNKETPNGGSHHKNIIIIIIGILVITIIIIMTFLFLNKKSSSTDSDSTGKSNDFFSKEEIVKYSAKGALTNKGNLYAVGDNYFLDNKTDKVTLVKNNIKVLYDTYYIDNNGTVFLSGISWKGGSSKNKELFENAKYVSGTGVCNTLVNSNDELYIFNSMWSSCLKLHKDEYYKLADNVIKSFEYIYKGVFYLDKDGNFVNIDYDGNLNVLDSNVKDIILNYNDFSITILKNNSELYLYHFVDDISYDKIVDNVKEIGEYWYKSNDGKSYYLKNSQFIELPGADIENMLYIWPTKKIFIYTNNSNKIILQSDAISKTIDNNVQNLKEIVDFLNESTN